MRAGGRWRGCLPTTLCFTLPTALILGSGCSFVERGGGWNQDRYEYESAPQSLIEKWIRDVSAAQDRGEDFATASRELLDSGWRDLVHYREGEGLPVPRARSEWDRRPWLLNGGSWDEVLGRLYAARSTCIVQHVPFDTTSMVCVRMIGSWQNDAMDAVIVPMIVMAPLDLVIAPVELVYRSVQHLRVRGDELEEALRSLEKARRLGFEVKWDSFGGAFARRYYLDQLGYRISK